MPLLKPEDAKDHVNSWRTMSLFIECNNSALTPVFTLGYTDLEKNGVTYKAIYPLFIELTVDDPTEYEFSQAVFGSWKHWDRIRTSNFLAKYFEEWREEAEIKRRSGMLKAMIQTAKNDGSKGTTAAKYIAEQGWSKKRGRPSKAEIARETRIEAGLNKEIEEDAQRIGKAH